MALQGESGKNKDGVNGEGESLNSLDANILRFDLNSVKDYFRSLTSHHGVALMCRQIPSNDRGG